MADKSVAENSGGGFLLSVPAFFSILFLSAHFLRAQNLLLTGICLCGILLLLFNEKIHLRIVQVELFFGGLIWVLTLFVRTIERLESGGNVLRMAMILLAVALFSWWSVYLLQKRISRIPAKSGPSLQEPELQAEGEHE